MINGFILILTLPIIVSVFFTIYGSYQSKTIHYICKPLTTFLIIALACGISLKFDAYRILIICGLCFSLAGDIFIMHPKDKFIQGLIAFFIAHIFYICAFYIHIHLWNYISVIPLVLYGFFFYLYLFKNLKDMKLAVLFYIIIILLMMWFSFLQWFNYLNWQSVLAFTGALFFAASDSIIAIDRFKFNFKKAQFLILLTYFIAQYLIAFSTFD
jgi:uncharacterized membrane protein YhhN